MIQKYVLHSILLFGTKQGGVYKVELDTLQCDDWLSELSLQCNNNYLMVPACLSHPIYFLCYVFVNLNGIVVCVKKMVLLLSSLSVVYCFEFFFVVFIGKQQCVARVKQLLQSCLHTPEGKHNHAMLQSTAC